MKAPDDPRAINTFYALYGKSSFPTEAAAKEAMDEIIQDIKESDETVERIKNSPWEADIQKIAE